MIKFKSTFSPLEIQMAMPFDFCLLQSYIWENSGNRFLLAQSPGRYVWVTLRLPLSRHYTQETYL